jgi:hypothetical protein
MMSDQTSALYPLALACLKGHAAIRALFPPGKVRVFEVAPDNIQGLYIVLGLDDFSPLAGDSIRAGEAAFTVHIWSRTDPPSKTQATQAGAAVVEAMLSLAGSPTIAVKSLDHIRSAYLLQPDNATVHGVIAFSATTEAR